MDPEIRKYLSKIGKTGGQKGKGKAKARSSEQARKAAQARWKKVKKAPNGP